jgi:hypothetical protein
MRRALAAILLLCACVAKEEDPHKLGTDNKVKPAPAVTTISNLAGPESALYDPDQDVYFISNINGGLLDRDDNGFITRVNAQTLQVDLKWIESGKNGVHLDGGKGMAIVGNTLYVSDVTAVKKFDRHTGAPLGEIPLPGATTINDLATDGTNVFASDTGVIPGPGNSFKPTATDSIWEITNDKATKIASGTDLGQPNGLVVVDGKLWAITFGGDELYRLDNGKKTDVTKLPNRQLDGVVHLDDGSFVVTSWYASAIFRGKPGGKFESILQSINTPADIGYDTKRHLLLVPNSTDNHVTLHPVK